MKVRSFAHLARMTTPFGLHEHARAADPRHEHGYCVDDAARALVVTTREPEASAAVLGLTAVYLRFTADAITADGRAHNRRLGAGPWLDEPATGDHWGRAVWGLATVASRHPDASLREQALGAALRAAQARSVDSRAMAHAAVGAFEILSAHPGNAVALGLMADAREVIGSPTDSAAWPWPEPRLRYANALVPEAMILAGQALGDERTLAQGLDLLAWLVDQETRGAHLSVTPVAGRGPGERSPGFDQQPIEVWSLAEACTRAAACTGDSHWAQTVERCAAWFLGENDTGIAMYDSGTGGGFDGLLHDGVNLNQGAESTLAALATLQLAGVTTALVGSAAR